MFVRLTRQLTAMLMFKPGWCAPSDQTQIKMNNFIKSKTFNIILIIILIATTIFCALAALLLAALTEGANPSKSAVEQIGFKYLVWFLVPVILWGSYAF